jgi:hypothetical protein
MKREPGFGLFDKSVKSSLKKRKSSHDCEPRSSSSEISRRPHAAGSSGQKYRGTHSRGPDRENRNHGGKSKYSDRSGSSSSRPLPSSEEDTHFGLPQNLISQKCPAAAGQSVQPQVSCQKKKVIQKVQDDDDGGDDYLAYASVVNMRVSGDPETPVIQSSPSVVKTKAGPAVGILQLDRSMHLKVLECLTPNITWPALVGSQLFSKPLMTRKDLLSLQNIPCRKHLKGPILKALGRMLNLRFLALKKNCLITAGPIPPQLGQLKMLTHLYLDFNNLTGPIPTELGQMSSLQELRLSGNRLTGEIPASLSNLSNLRELQLDRNSLTGSIPTAVGQLKALERLDLCHNNLTGNIPAELGTLPNLVELCLNDNHLTGSVPANCNSKIAHYRVPGDPGYGGHHIQRYH